MNKSIYFVSIIIIVIIFNLLIIDYNYNNKIIKLTDKYKPKLIKFIKYNLTNSGNKLFFIPFFELGDNIVINGAVRYYCTIYNSVTLVCKKMYYNQIQNMYIDLNNLYIYVIPDMYTNQYINYYVPYDNEEIQTLFKINKIKILNIADHFLNYNMIINYDYVLRSYKSLNLNVNIGYKYFKTNRNYNIELDIYNKLVEIIGEKYVIVIDDEKRNFLINDTYINKIKLPIFKLGMNSKNDNPKLDLLKNSYIFNYTTILEKADTVLSIDTSIPWICDFLNIKCNLYIYNSRIDDIKFKNKNIKLLDVKYSDKIKSLCNINNYVWKYPLDWVKTYITI
jgi:hypothetical protein